MTGNTFDFGPMLDAYVARYTVGFVTIDSGDPRPLGSGTLVKTKTTQGILTCAHVLSEIKKHKSIGISLFPAYNKFQQYRISVEDFVDAAISFYDEPPTADGRDLAYLPLPINFMATLEAAGSVLDLELHEARSKVAAPVGASSLEVVGGVLDQRTPPAATQKQRLLLSVEGLINVGRVIATRQHKNFDLLEFEPKPDPNFKTPTTYEATSGGGMWRLHVRDDGDGTYSLMECRLIGVVFWETDPPNRNLIGHGPASIFGHLLSAIRSQSL